MKDGKILKWNYKVGDKVTAGDTIAEIQTDKSTVGFEVQDDGYIGQILAPEGNQDVEVGKPVVVIVKKKDSVAAFSNYTGEATAEAGEEVEHKEEAETEKAEGEAEQPKDG